MIFIFSNLPLLCLLSLPLLFTIVSAIAITTTNDTNPMVKSSTVVGVVTDPTLNRDSCGSVKWGSRVLWTCRDTNVLQDGIPINFFSSSASYSSVNSDNTPVLVDEPFDQPLGLDYPSAYILSGDNKNISFFSILQDECSQDGNQGGNCYNGSRYAIWPDQPPFVTNEDEDSGIITAYTWIKRELIADLTNQIPDPPATLYKVTGSDLDEELPQVNVVAEEFYPLNHFAYGEYGSLIIDDTAYLYGINSNFSISLARVTLESIEDISKYEYYVGSKWITTPPTVYDTSAYLTGGAPGAGGGQGTFYYSSIWGKYVWLGQPGGFADPQFYISVSSRAEGPWSEATLVIDVPPGNYTGIGAYTLQAHPHLTPQGKNQIYVSYTQQYTNHYETPMYLIEWN